MSAGSAGIQSNGASFTASISDGGRFVAFWSSASNLVPGDTNASDDVFVRDRQTGSTTRVSVDSAGAEANGRSSDPMISADGRFVVFESDASNLAPGDTNGCRDIFVHDRQSGLIARVSVDDGAIQGNGNSYNPLVSPDGRHVAFESDASNLVPGDANGSRDVFVHDRQTGVTERVSVGTGAVESNGDSGHPAISPDGRYTAFYSGGSNLVPGDTNARLDVFVLDRQAGITERVSVAAAGVESNGDSTQPTISSDGRYVSFLSLASNLVPGDTNGAGDVFVHDRQAAQTSRVSVSSSGIQGNGLSGGARVSSDFRYVSFESWATNLVPGDTNGRADAFVHDRTTAQTMRVSVDSSGVQANDGTHANFISTDGRFTAFHSYATNLVPGDTNGVWDVFLRDITDCWPTAGTYCTPKVNSLGCTPVIAPSGTPSFNGGTGSFTITASELISQKVGLLFYGFAQIAKPFQGGTLCVAGPTRRTPAARTHGSSTGDDCTGAITFDMGGHIATRVDAGLVIGAHVYSQVWSRDPADPYTTNLTAGVEFTIGP